VKILDLPAHVDPVQTFQSLAHLPYPALLDSAPVPGIANPLARRSFVAAEPFLVVHAKGRAARLCWPRSGREETWQGNPFELLRQVLGEYRTPAPGPFPLASGGIIGYLAYDLFPHVEQVARHTVDDLGMPDLFVACYDAVAVFDHLRGTLQLAINDWGHGGGRAARERWQALADGALDDSPAAAATVDAGALVSNFTRDGYRRAIRETQEYIAAGDIYQANISQRFSVPYPGDPVALYRSLRRTSPAPFGACLFPDGFAVLSNSPERYLLIDGAHIETRPIKGTRPRGRDAAEDQQLAAELRASAKDRAEHVMIVDLERNDLGRVCDYASVRVPEFEVVESYANVHHMVSTVAGRVHPSRDAVDCIRNSFPGGSITGAPKVRAMEVIEELEPTARGVYCGAIGYIDFAGRADLNIAIRTAVLGGGRLHFQVGGGIVADSDPDDEYQETLTKAQSFLKVLTGEGRVWNGAA